MIVQRQLTDKTLTNFSRAGRSPHASRHILMATVGFLVLPMPALAQDRADASELLTLVREQSALLQRQSRELAELRSRLETVESRATSQPVTSIMVPQGASTQTVPAQPAPSPTQAQPVQSAQQTLQPSGLIPFSPQIVPPGPADASIAMARALAANPAGVTTEWGAGAPIFTSADGIFSFKPRGRLIEDFSTTSGSRYNGRNITTTGARALRLGIEGAVGTRFIYQLEFDFSENSADVVTAYVGYRNHLIAGVDYDIRLGHLVNDRSFEGITGSDSTPFHDRNVVANAIIPQRGVYGIGGQIRLFGPNWHFSTQLTGDRVDGDQSVEDGRTVIVRGHWNPVKGDRNLAHIGAWVFDENLSPSQRTLTRSTVIGGRFNGALRVQSGPLDGGTGTTGYGGELGGYLGPLWLMGEAGHRIARRDTGPSLMTDAWSMSGGFFLTGELPPYNPRTGQFDQPKVKRSTFNGGPGAIELTARYEWLRFYNVPLGGKGWEATLGVNWYLNPFTRIMVNATHWNTDNRAGSYVGADDGQTLATRFAVSF
jgi:phosphate-selective porin OprO/OprP